VRYRNADLTLTAKRHRKEGKKADQDPERRIIDSMMSRNIGEEEIMQSKSSCMQEALWRMKAMLTLMSNLCG
jgi:hypothetical protein